MNLEDKNASLLRREKALADFGTFAFREPNLQIVLDEAARVSAECLGASFSKICKFRPLQDDLLFVSGYGWQAGVVGFAISVADESSPQGRAFTTGLPQRCANISEANTYALPPFYTTHSVLATVDVLVATRDGQPFGVLEVDSQVDDAFDDHDIDFLTGFANVLAEAVATAVRADELRKTIRRMEELVDEKETLSQELRHRVRNNLHLVYGLLTAEIDGNHDDASIAAFRSIALRVIGLAQVFDHLLGVGMDRIISFSDYMRGLCESLPDLYRDTKITLSFVSDSSVQVELDTATALGIVVTELVNNAYLHAFGGGAGRIAVTLRLDGANASIAIQDDGAGFAEVPTGRRGMGLVRRLVEQVGGNLTLRRANGSTWTITFPIGDDAPLLAA
jgi:two-component sensor histidine kinase